MFNCYVVGVLVKEPEYSTSYKTGSSIAKFRIAINCNKDAKGNPLTLFATCVAWKGWAEMVRQDLHKGSRVLVSGQLKPNIWTKSDGTVVNDLNIETNFMVQIKNQNEKTEAAALPDVENNSDNERYTYENANEELPF